LGRGRKTSTRLGGPLAALVFAGAASGAAGASSQPGVLRVCADPNNLPFSNRAGEGFENKIVALLAQELGETVQYTWWAQRRGFVRNTLGAGDCDLWPGVATDVGMLATTRPYYRSSYVFISRADHRLGLESFDDPRLRRLVVGVQMIGDDAMNTPPAHALARRGITANVRGYMLYGDYSRRDPGGAIIDAVARGDIDVAVAWGPTAGFFAARSPVKMTLARVEPSQDGPQWPMAFDISMGVRRTDQAFRREIDRLLEREGPAINAILASYGVPVTPKPSPVEGGGQPSGRLPDASR
jgi:mxaJ protein